MARKLAIPCSFCGRKFGGNETWNRHRFIAGDKVGCYSDEELRSRGLYRDEWMVWHRSPMPGQTSLLGVTESDISATAPRKLARVSDPETSHAAAKAVAYRTGTQKARLLQAYLEAPEGLTDEEAGIRVGLPQAWKRCSDLRNDGVIESVGVKDGPHGTPVMVCKAVAEEAAS